MKKYVIFIIVLLLISFSTSVFATTHNLEIRDGLIVSDSGEDALSVWGEFINKYKNFVIPIAAIGAVSMVMFFILAFIKLGASAGNPQARSQAITGLIVTGIAATLLGGVALITSIFYNAIK